MKDNKQKFEPEFVDNFSEEDFFDDCPICQAMKAAKKEGRELSLPELQELFKRANDEQKLKN